MAFKQGIGQYFSACKYEIVNLEIENKNYPFENQGKKVILKHNSAFIDKIKNI